MQPKTQIFKGQTYFFQCALTARAAMVMGMAVMKVK